MKSRFIHLKLFLLIIIGKINAYCVYNNSDNKFILFRQRNFNTKADVTALFDSGNMSPSSRKCCPYTNKDCSSYSNKENVLIMDVFTLNISLRTITFPSGGWIKVTDIDNNPRDVNISVYNADGSPFLSTDLGPISYHLE